MWVFASGTAALVTGLFIRYLVQAWQARNWLNQQRLLGAEKKYSNMLTLFSDISDSASRRLTAMYRLGDALGFEDDNRVKKRLEDYDDALRQWNEKLNGIYVRLTALLGQAESTRLEREVQDGFLRAGAKLEVLTRSRLKGEKISRRRREDVKPDLNHIQGLLRNFNRDFLNLLEVEHSTIYYGQFVEFNETNLDSFSTWELFKALLKKRVERHRVLRAPLDLPAPAIDWE